MAHKIAEEEEENEIDVENDEANKEVTYEDVVNLINDGKEPDNLDIEGLEDFIIHPVSNISVNDVKVEKVKRVRVVKKMEEPIVVPDAKSSDDEVVEIKKEEDSKIKNDGNIKVVELSQCDKCGKKLTARTLKYTHNNVFPANENKSPPKPKRVKQNDSNVDIVVSTTDQSQPPARVERIKKRKDKFNVLFSGAV